MTQLRDLARKFPQSVVKANPSGGGSYVPHHLYVQRLLMHLGAYDFELVELIRGEVAAIEPLPKDKWTDKTSNRKKYGAPALSGAVCGVIARLTVTVDGAKVVIEDAGDCEDPHNWPHDGARAKDAMSDALKRCCARIGLGTHLYAKTPDDYVLYRVLTDQEMFEAGPSGGGEPSGQTLVAGNPAGESKDLTVPANLSPAPSEFCEACVAGDCQHCTDHLDHDDQGGAPFFCDCKHDETRPM